jgi:hypothetical protein
MAQLRGELDGHHGGWHDQGGLFSLSAFCLTSETVSTIWEYNT